MKSFKLLQILFLLALNSCESCEEKVWTELPPETQKGANTFGCYVNDQLFVAEKGYGPFGGRYLSAGYAKNTDLLLKIAC
ncbi:hypothetical protein FACS189426_13210 [Bacteroidia bacterium]|nr:hypothetical protein FACS189426_13210 [Bacteroidia bacterium]GHT87022.1 hypothetical protein FACS18947_7110 [Bacteroidia bacterium]